VPRAASCPCHPSLACHGQLVARATRHPRATGSSLPVPPRFPSREALARSCLPLTLFPRLGVPSCLGRQAPQHHRPGRPDRRARPAAALQAAVKNSSSPVRIPQDRQPGEKPRGPSPDGQPGGCGTRLRKKRRLPWHGPQTVPQLIPPWHGPQTVSLPCHGTVSRPCHDRRGS